MVTINNDADQDIINQNPTPHEIKERLAELSLNGKTQQHQKKQSNDNSDQENQKPNHNGVGRKKSKKQRISLTPGFYGGHNRNNKNGHEENDHDKISSILGVKDYSPFERSRARRNKENDEIEPTEKLFIGKLPLNLTEEELYAHFSQFGTIVEAIIKEQRGFGFVTFGTIDEANEALQADHILHEQEIEVKRAMPNRFAQSSRQDSHISQPALVDQSQWDYAMYQAQPYAYPQPMYAIPTYPPPLIPSVTPIEPVSPPHDETTNSQSPHETTSDKSDYVEHRSELDGDLKQQCKLFIGGLHWKTQDSDLKDYFSKMGTVTDAMVILEPNSQRSRGFGFVVFSNAEEAQNVFLDKEHEINGKMVEVKRAISKDQMKLKTDSESDFHPTKNKDDSDSEKLAHVPVDKIFVGGIRKDTTKEFLIQYFQNTFDGNVTRVDMKTDGDGANRGFAFITFDSTEVVDKICNSKFHRIGSHFCEVKKAHPKNNEFDNNNVRRNEKNVDYQPSYRAFDNYAYTAFPHPQVWYHPGYVQPPPHPTTAAAAPMNGHYGSNGELGEYIGGTWYPKQPSDSGIDDSPMAAPASYGIPALVYPAAAYSYYPSAAYPSTAYFPTTSPSTGLTQKDI